MGLDDSQPDPDRWAQCASIKHILHGVISAMVD
jgi:hypothetical protein